MAVTVALDSGFAILDTIESVATMIMVGTIGTDVATPDWEEPQGGGSNVQAWGHDVATGGYIFPFSSTDYSTAHFFDWGAFMNAFNLEAKVVGSGQSGVFLIARDTSSNLGYWHVDGFPEYRGGMKRFVVYLGSTPDSNSGTAPDMSVCNALGIGYKSLVKSKSTYNAFQELTHIGNGRIILTTSSSSVADFDDYVTGDNGIGTGIIRDTGGGVYALIGHLVFGNTSTGDMEFLDTGKVLVFEDRPVNPGMYGFTVQGNASGTIEFQIGTKVGTRGIQGGSIICPGAQRPVWTATDEDIDVLKLYGVTFSGWGTMGFPTYTTAREAVDCAFADCGLITPSTMTFKFCNFIDALATAMIISSTSHHVSDSNFINCPVAIEIDTPGSYGFTNVICSGCTTDIENSCDATNEDSYASTNRDGDTSIGGALTNDAVGQAFYCTTGGDLANIEVMLSKSGSPAGNVTVEIYAVTGTPGTDAVPTGSVLATSDPLDASTLDGTPTLKRLQFSGDEIYTMSSTTWYFAVVRYADSDGSILVGDDTSSPSHSGNAAVQAVSGDTWTAQAGKDLIFYARRGGIVIISNSGGAIATHTETGTPPGATTIQNTRYYRLTGLDTGTLAVFVTDPGGVELYAATESGGVVQYDYNWAGDIDIFIQLIDLSMNIQIIENVTLTSTSAIVPVTQTTDNVYYNP